MATTIFILGAGASKDAGTPLMADFLDVAHSLWKSNKIPDSKNFETVFGGISKLQLVHSKSQLDIQNVESVFAAFEMARTLQQFSDYTPEELEGLVAAMKSVIVATVQQTLQIPVESRRPVAPYPYRAFVDILAKLLENTHSSRLPAAVITFNYDMALDLAFHFSGIPIRYGLGESERVGNLPVLKLHGSLNWAECSVCNQVIPVLLSDYFSKYNWSFIDTDTKNLTMNIGSHIGHFPHETHAVHAEPFIVPPTWNKSQYHSTLSSVWALAAKELSEAENIFVIGYSLPSSDAFFRFLYALGTVGDIPLKRFWVFNPDKSGDVENRFRAMLGPGAIQRFNYYNMTFAESLGPIAKALLDTD